MQDSGATCREDAAACLFVIASEAKQSRESSRRFWIASAFAQERFGGLLPGEARAARRFAPRNDGGTWLFSKSTIEKR
jgi:hypothetical protein